MANSNKKINLSIIIPVFNSSKILKKLTHQIKKNLNSKKLKRYEVIFVNDNSIDDSWNTIKKLSRNRSNFVKGINFRYNFGQHPALFAGIKYSRGERIILMDDDLQHSPEYLVKIYNKLNQYDLCYTKYQKREHVFWKRFVSFLNNIFATIIFDKPLNIYLSSFKGFNKHLKKNFITNKKKIILVDAMLIKSTKRICSIDILHQRRFKGESNYNIKNLFSLWFDSIENFHFYPIRIGSLVGFIFFLIIKVLRLFSKSKNSQFQILEKTF